MKNEENQQKILTSKRNFSYKIYCDLEKIRNNFNDPDLHAFNVEWCCFLLFEIVKVVKQYLTKKKT